MEPTDSEYMRMQLAQLNAWLVNLKIDLTKHKGYTYRDFLLREKTPEEIEQEQINHQKAVLNKVLMLAELFKQSPEWSAEAKHDTAH